MAYKKIDYLWAILRLSMGWIFLWPFLDKLFGLGFATEKASAWIVGGSPTLVFLSYATTGPFAILYQSIAGKVFVDWLFMIGLLLIGLALLSGVGVKIAGYSGALMLFLMWTAVLPPEHNPFLDEHIIYAIVLIVLTFVKSGHCLGFGKWWSKQRIVKKYSLLN